VGAGKAYAIRYGDRTAFRFDYIPALITRLKYEIPSRHREWLPDEKIWVVDSAFAGRMMTLVRMYFDQVEVLDKRGKEPPREERRRDTPRPPRPTAGGGRTWTEVLFNRLPKELHEPTFKALVKVLHPDRGGDLAMMKELNDYYRNGGG
jgi:hypothetical protein